MRQAKEDGNDNSREKFKVVCIETKPDNKVLNNVIYDTAKKDRVVKEKFIFFAFYPCNYGAQRL